MLCTPRERRERTAGRRGNNVRSFVMRIGLLVAGCVLVLPATLSCSSPIVHYLTAERQGNVTFVFVNDTPFRAAFSFGTYDALDHTPGATELRQLRVAAKSSSAPVTVTCRRNAAIGTEEYVQRVIDTEADLAATNFIPDAFDTTVHFSSAPDGSPTADLPIDGFAVGVEKLLGIDFSCSDQLMFTFREDPDAEGGFRIDFSVISDNPEL